MSDAQLGGFGGGQFGQEASFFQGWLDEIRFYDRALEPNEIIEGMNAVLNVPTEENLIGYWRFDEGNGLNAIDMSPSRNDGQIIGANWSTELPDQIAPEVPSGLFALAGDHEVSLNWQENVEIDLHGYNIYRFSSNESAQIITALGKNDTTYVDYSAENGVTYFYSITSFDLSQNESAKSDTISATPVNVPPSRPRGIEIASGDGQVSLGWLSNQEWDIDSYGIYMSQESGFIINDETLFTYVDHPDTHLVITGLTNSQVYYFLLSARDQSELESTVSEELIGTPIDVAPNQPIALVVLDSRIELF